MFISPVGACSAASGSTLGSLLEPLWALLSVLGAYVGDRGTRADYSPGPFASFSMDTYLRASLIGVALR